MDRLHLAQVADPAGADEGAELGGGPRIGGPGVRVADGDGEEFPEAAFGAFA